MPKRFSELLELMRAKVPHTPRGAPLDAILAELANLAKQVEDDYFKDPDNAVSDDPKGEK